MKFIIESNCVNPPKENFEIFIPVIQGYLDRIIATFHIDSLEYFVIADSEQNNFNETVKRYAAMIGTDTNITDNEGYQTAAKSIDGVDENGIYRQAIIIKSMLCVSAGYDLLRLSGELPQKTLDAMDNIKFVSLLTIVHEVGHAVDNVYQFNREGYCNQQIHFDLSIPEEYRKFLNRSALALWGEYFAERFSYSTLQIEEKIQDKSQVLLDCIHSYSKGSFTNQITERVYMILYYFVHDLGFCQYINKRFNYSIFNDEESVEYIPYLKMIEELMERIYSMLPDWNEDAFDELVSEYHNFLMYEKAKQENTLGLGTRNSQ